MEKVYEEEEEEEEEVLNSHYQTKTKIFIFQKYFDMVLLCFFKVCIESLHNTKNQHCEHLRTPHLPTSHKIRNQEQELKQVK